MTRYYINDLLKKGKDANHEEVIVKGWVRSFRSNRFISLNDGTSLGNIQVVVDFENFDEELLKKISVASSLKVTGTVVESQGKGQEIEVLAKKIEVYGEVNPDELQETILQPKKHSLEKLREQAHLRFRTNTFGAIMRVRHALMFAIHDYFNQKGFFYVNTPIITGSDAEGAGEMFTVTNFTLGEEPRNEEGAVDFKEDFFGKKTNLTVSGQLEAETAAMGLGKVYTFGPTFRAENSNTSRHLAEFWMIEPEVAFNDLDDNMDLAEDFMKYVIKYALDHCQEDLKFLDERYKKTQEEKPKNERAELGLIERLEYVLNNKFVRLSYTEAIEILKKSKPNQKKKFKYLIEEWGADLQSEHERYLVEKHFKSPVILFDYPAKIKAFYMRLNDDKETVRAMDVLFPSIGEIIGGSQREERLDVLKEKMQKMGVSEEELWWYLDTRRFGTVPHSGFGLGLERLVLFVTGMSNIRDVIPFPRTPKNAEF
ncbi:asparagine--tRNA ligase [Ornithobacterium rhinotracheale]|uniref:Asparagine--tRNA ligase n=1 Tax=Ornithobacterium rhinotracheale (strain ATCC 51463 / DSM 15997 / CCUG 23171 / CIP 104009 / LMG 9086) TaxID=867902 RepID=I3ZXF6_ORNRL|nr:asparagine--tRNA ligase [Ornithobacterium rhinotracheale]AFL96390.1 asparaginyl-tRNA synthetase [Ornithobacterium rhinotracheale DSM 15997]AIP98615.1 asparaginyl-tRNA synthetase [Ornithobacterium rhinotracheale ORT-UMN 88]KGB67619.1 asparaginyl-tRNA synthetase [Ornithobacterium rhinotracheale H06-030791]MCK0194719.1 asparagine--tRNA ligase [Ornithobacterium rhinotracheale]MCK0201086.1 asparagine--tRNA ligase [Ornithobacterium rhinotracheale]